jgi:uncharacterized protein RhaS with RHS repeats
MASSAQTAAAPAPAPVDDAASGPAPVAASGASASGAAPAAAAAITRAFWSSMYKWQSASGGNTISGWITLFFPVLIHKYTRKLYLNSRLAHLCRGVAAVAAGDLDLATDERRYYEPTADGDDDDDEDADDDDEVGDEGAAAAAAGGASSAAAGAAAASHKEKKKRLPGFPCFPSDKGEFGTGLGSCDFQWDYFRRRIPMRLVAGFLGVTQNPKTLCLSAPLDWALVHVA